ncbi:13991_t:CDS:2 [Cetraspora pellucida]|uniref:13991_t:CDS:1 n=1 Tax=Cetraspora pellucida TaxID=1433469 RepID=A0ACA9LQS7_9GLOM|nr:13991_t:CDS:2 [Cetraspora pellucida]
MSSVFCVISYIKTVSDNGKTWSGVAVYRTSDTEFNEYKFKAFCTNELSLIEDICKTNISLVIGRFVIENDELNVTIAQHVPLNILTINDESTIYDLPIALAFGIFSAPIQDPSMPERNGAIFRLKKDVYNSLTSTTVPMAVVCKYNPQAKVIDWCYQSSGTIKSQTNTESNHPYQCGKRSRDDELDKIAEKFDLRQKSSSPPLKRQTQKNYEKMRQDASLSEITVTSSELTRSEKLTNTLRNNKETVIDLDNGDDEFGLSLREVDLKLKISNTTKLNHMIRNIRGSSNRNYKNNQTVTVNDNNNEGIDLLTNDMDLNMEIQKSTNLKCSTKNLQETKKGTLSNRNEVLNKELNEIAVQPENINVITKTKNAISKDNNPMDNQVKNFTNNAAIEISESLDV